MTVVGVLSLVADVLFIGWSAFIVIVLLVFTIGKLFGARTILDEEDPDEDDVYLERLDKLQESVDCLAARRLDGEELYNIQCSGYSREKEEVKRDNYIDETLLDEIDLDKINAICYSALDGLITQQSDILKLCYRKLPDDSDKKHTKKRRKLERDVDYARIMLEFYSFMHSHGVGAFSFVLRSKFFGDAIERKNNLEDSSGEEQIY